jgi:hypothetical protein
MLIEAKCYDLNKPLGRGQKVCLFSQFMKMYVGTPVRDGYICNYVVVAQKKAAFK